MLNLGVLWWVMQKVIINIVMLLCIVCCDAPGPLDIDLYWQKVETGEFTWCDRVDVDLANYIIYDDRTDDVELDIIGPCEDSIHFYSEGAGGYYTLEVKGYYFAGPFTKMDLALGWHAVCESMRVNGRDTERFECRVPLYDKEKMLDDYRNTGRIAKVATPMLENR